MSSTFFSRVADDEIGQIFSDYENDFNHLDDIFRVEDNPDDMRLGLEPLHTPGPADFDRQSTSSIQNFTANLTLDSDTDYQRRSAECAMWYSSSEDDYMYDAFGDFMQYTNEYVPPYMVKKINCDIAVGFPVNDLQIVCDLMDAAVCKVRGNK
ncbi:unnamed protein product [Caenorhabditis bovis]|uniref:Uncharacterized protein n=1 Tax=Caenorhabditis bovis TaxID=2654633 RepID=A0A8S1EJC7_9PELO|nr:unnamed protein product [Caenorhabditis bovis]